MALIIALTSPNLGTDYYLKAESASHSITRFAIQTPLPHDPATAGPNVAQVIIVDLGMGREEWTIQGIVDTASGAGFPSKSQLEFAARNWFGLGVEDTGLAILTVGTGSYDSYLGSIKSLDFRWEAAMEDRWQFTLSFLVKQVTGNPL